MTLDSQMSKAEYKAVVTEAQQIEKLFQSWLI